MKFADTHTIEILEYKGWLIVKLIRNTPKLRSIGSGLILSDFNKNDVKISENALKILTDNVNKNLDKENPVFEVISNERISWLSNNGLLIPPDEIMYIHVWDIPFHTICENIVDPLIQKKIDEY